MKWFLPVLFISYMAGITLFTHSHVVNGVTIVHSHPFKKGSEHSHTTVEFQLIHLLNHVLVTDSGLIPTFAVAALSLLCILFIRPSDEAIMQRFDSYSAVQLDGFLNRYREYYTDEFIERFSTAEKGIDKLHILDDEVFELYQANSTRQS